MTMYSIYLAYTLITPTQNFLGNFGTCRVTVWSRYIPSLYLVYTWYMIWPYRNVTGTEIFQKVLSRCMPGIYCTSSYERFIHILYQVYIPGIYYLSIVYIRCMLGIQHIRVHMEPSLFNDVIYLVYVSI